MVFSCLFFLLTFKNKTLILNTPKAHISKIVQNKHNAPLIAVAQNNAQKLLKILCVNAPIAVVIQQIHAHTKIVLTKAKSNKCFCFKVIKLSAPEITFIQSKPTNIASPPIYCGNNITPATSPSAPIT